MELDFKASITVPIFQDTFTFRNLAKIEAEISSLKFDDVYLFKKGVTLPCDSGMRDNPSLFLVFFFCWCRHIIFGRSDVRTSALPYRSRLQPIIQLDPVFDLLKIR